MSLFERWDKMKSDTYILHCYSERKDGRKDTFYTLTGLSRSKAYRMARDARANGETATVKREES